MQKNICRTVVFVLMAALLAAIGVFEFVSAMTRDILLLFFLVVLLFHLLLNRSTLLHPSKRRVRPHSAARHDMNGVLKLILPAVYTAFIVTGLLSSRLLPFLYIGAPLITLLHRLSYAAALLLTIVHAVLHRGFLKKAWRNVFVKRPLSAILTVLAAVLLIASAVCLGAAADKRDPAPAAIPFGTAKPLPTFSSAVPTTPAVSADPSEGGIAPPIPTPGFGLGSPGLTPPLLP